MGTEHTELPWVYDGDRYIRHSTTDATIAMVMDDDGHCDSEYAEDLPKEANAELIVKAVNNYDKLVEALRDAARLIKTARRYFPKSIKNSDRFQLENTCATVNKAISKSVGTGA